MNGERTLILSTIASPTGSHRWVRPAWKTITAPATAFAVASNRWST
jgi:hypothetical protein